MLDDFASRLREMARNPLILFVLVMVYLQGGKNLQVLANRGRLFQSFTHYLLKHEQDWHPDALSADAKIDLLSALAYAMQQQGSGTTFEPASAKKAIPDSVLVLGEQTPVDKEALLRFGARRIYPRSGHPAGCALLSSSIAGILRRPRTVAAF